MDNNEKSYELIKFEDGDFSLDVKVSPKEDTVWLTQDQIATLFGKARNTISEHINSIFSSKELDSNTSVGFSDISGSHRPAKLYNLDVVLAVGYRVNSKRGIVFRRWANSILKQYLLNGYVINETRVIVSNENYIELRNEVVSINDRLVRIEDKVFDKQYGLDKLFFNGQFYDAYTLIQNIFEKAKEEIIIIDNYIDRSILDRLVVKKIDVRVIIYTNINTSKINDIDINTFNKQYGNLNIINTLKVHDRYIIIDKIKLYHLGASIKDLGKKIFSISELDKELINTLLTKI